MVQDEIKPLFAYPPMDEQFTLEQAAERIADATLSKDEAKNKLRHYLATRLIHVRQRKDGRSGRTVPNVLEIEDLAVAKVLAVLGQDFGVADRDIPPLVSTALYQGGGSVRHRISHLLDATRERRWWVLRIDALRSDLDGHRELDAYVFDMDAKPPKRSRTPDLLHRSAMTVQLYPLLCDLLRIPVRER